jgi:hypothetical protein
MCAHESDVQSTEEAGAQITWGAEMCSVVNDASKSDTTDECTQHTDYRRKGTRIGTPRECETMY